MYELKNPKDIRCPLEYAMDIFGGKWKSRVVCVLDTHSVLRYSALRRQLVNITEHVLIATLKELMESGLVWRKSYDETPPKVEYSLTDKGKSILPIFRSMCGWAKQFYIPEGERQLSGQCLTCVHNPSKAEKCRQNH